jgi:hypothetical protein
MTGIPVLVAVDRVIELVSPLSDDEYIAYMMRELRIVRADLRAALEDLEDAEKRGDDTARLRAYTRRNSATRQLQAYMASLGELLKLPVAV